MIDLRRLDKNEILPAHVMPTGANLDIVNPLPTTNPTDPKKNSETILGTFFLIKPLYFFV